MTKRQHAGNAFLSNTSHLWFLRNVFVFVTCERCIGLDLSATHCVFPAIAWVTLSIHIFFRGSLNVVVTDGVSANYFSQVSCSFERYDWVSLKCFSHLQSRPVLFHDLQDIWGRSVLRYSQKYTTDIVVILVFLKKDFSRDITRLFNFFFDVISSISSFDKFFV